MVCFYKQYLYPCVKIPTTTMLPPRVPVRWGCSTAFGVSTVVACKADAFSQAMSATESLIAPMDQTKSIADTKGVHHNSLFEHRQLSGLSPNTGFPLLSLCSTFKLTFCLQNCKDVDVFACWAYGNVLN